MRQQNDTLPYFPSGRWHELQVRNHRLTLGRHDRYITQTTHSGRFIWYPAGITRWCSHINTSKLSRFQKHPTLLRPTTLDALSADTNKPSSFTDLPPIMPPKDLGMPPCLSAETTGAEGKSLSTGVKRALEDDEDGRYEKRRCLEFVL